MVHCIAICCRPAPRIPFCWRVPCMQAQSAGLAGRVHRGRRAMRAAKLAVCASSEPLENSDTAKSFKRLQNGSDIRGVSIAGERLPGVLSGAFDHCELRFTMGLGAS